MHRYGSSASHTTRVELLLLKSKYTCVSVYGRSASHTTRVELLLLKSKYTCVSVLWPSSLQGQVGKILLGLSLNNLFHGV